MANLADATDRLTQNLEHTIQLHNELPASCPTKRLTRFRKAAKAFHRDYARIMKAHAQEAGTGIDLPRLTTLRIFVRLAEYRCTAGEPFFDLQLPHTVRVGTDSYREARLCVARRIFWIQDRVANGQEAYPADGRYADLDLISEDTLRRDLSPETRWLVDWSVIPPLELHALMLEVYFMHTKFWSFDAKIEDLMAKEEHVAVPVKKFTEPWTLRAILSKDDEDRRCVVCTLQYGVDSNNENSREPAVRTTCGHVFGSNCLQTWADSTNTCPFCRQPLFCKRLSLPDAVLFSYKRMERLRRSMMALDRQIDFFFWSIPQEVYGQSLGFLLEKLRSMNSSAEQYTQVVEQA